jgi:hypothetical protein
MSHSFISFLHWVGGSAVRKIYCTVLPHSPPKVSYGPWKLMYIELWYLCTSDRCGPVRNAFDAGKSIMRACARGLGPGN